VELLPHSARIVLASMHKDGVVHRKPV